MRHRLRVLLTDSGIRDDVCVLMRAEGRPANAPALYATPVTRSLLAALWGKAVVEYPTLHVVCAAHAAALAAGGVEMLHVLPSEAEEREVADERARAVAERVERRQAARKRAKDSAKGATAGDVQLAGGETGPAEDGGGVVAASGAEAEGGGAESCGEPAASAQPPPPSQSECSQGNGTNGANATGGSP